MIQVTWEEIATLVSQQELISQMAQDAATQDTEIEMLRQQLQVVSQDVAEVAQLRKENAMLHQITSELNAQIVALKQIGAIQYDQR